jgi:AcrR family transcriptional regulator
MPIRKAVLSTSENRREAVIESAISVFAASGYLGTPVTDIAKHARISTAYVFKLFPSKEELFVAALERCFELILAALAKGADECADQVPEAILFAMGGAYAALIADRNLLLLQIHAQSAAGVPAIGKAFCKGLEAVVRFVKSKSNAPDELVQRFVAYGQLCHLITTMGIEKSPAPWARVLTKGIRHV